MPRPRSRVAGCAAPSRQLGPHGRQVRVVEHPARPRISGPGTAGDGESLQGSAPVELLCGVEPRRAVECLLIGEGRRGSGGQGFIGPRAADRLAHEDRVREAVGDVAEADARVAVEHAVGRQTVVVVHAGSAPRADHVAVAAVDISIVAGDLSGGWVAGAEHDLERQREGRHEEGIGRFVVVSAEEARLREIEQLLQILLLEIGQEPRLHRETVGVRDKFLVVGLGRAERGDQRRQHVEGVVIVVHRDAELLEIIAADGAAGRLPRGLHRGEQQRNQDGDDRDHHQ